MRDVVRGKSYQGDDIRRRQWTYGRNVNNAHLLPNPNAMSIGSLTELSSFPFFKKRSGLNSYGSG